jgi:predicted RND superfamily exporter protein
MNASMSSLSELIVCSSKARRQLLQALNSKDRRIAQALKFILDEFEEMSKEQRAHSYENMQTIFNAMNQKEAHAHAEAQKQAQKEIDSELSKLVNGDDD